MPGELILVPHRARRAVAQVMSDVRDLHDARKAEAGVANAHDEVVVILVLEASQHQDFID